MKLFEYQAKELFRQAGIMVPEGRLAVTAKEAVQAVCAVGLPCMIKAQVLQGGRGKAGLIRRASSEGEAEKAACELFAQIAAGQKVLVEQAIDFDREVYLSVSLDPVSARYRIMACSEGGVEIETLARERPESILRGTAGIGSDLPDFVARELGYGLGLSGIALNLFCRVVQALVGIFRQYDAELAEINPLFLTAEGQVIAGDGKMILDDNSQFRQPKLTHTREYFDSDLEYEAWQEGIPYLQFDGDISLMCAGAGLTNTVYDLIHDAGGSVANYLEFGGANYTRASKAMELCLKNRSRVILIVTFGTIARADVMARGVVEAIRALQPNRPMVVCIRGTNEEEAARILREAGIAGYADTEEAVEEAVRLSKASILSAVPADVRQDPGGAQT